MHDYYSVSATICLKTTDKKGHAYIKTIQVPTFFLSSNVQGILSDSHAEKIAKEIVMPVPNKDMTVSICVMRHKKTPQEAIECVQDCIFPTEVS